LFYINYFKDGIVCVVAECVDVCSPEHSPEQLFSRMHDILENSLDWVLTRRRDYVEERAFDGLILTLTSSLSKPERKLIKLK